MSRIVAIGTRYLESYDAEYHIGLVAGDSSDPVATANTTKLNLALAAMYPQGLFAFAKGAPGPVLIPIQFSAKTFYFKGVIKTNVRNGGAIRGSCGPGYLLSSADYGVSGVLGGAVSRMVRIDGGTAVIRLRGSGFKISTMEILGRPYLTGTAGTGTKATAAVEVEGRATPATGKHLFQNAAFAEATYGIRALAGYYDDSDVFQTTNEHADESTVDVCRFTTVASAYRSESPQAVSWNFDNCHYNILGSVVPMIAADLVKGGNVRLGKPVINHPQFTIFKIRTASYTHGNDRVICEHFRWDAFAGATDYLCLLELDTTGLAVDTYMRWHAEISGHIGNVENGGNGIGDAHGYDHTQLLKLNGMSGRDEGSSVTTEDGLTNIWLNIAHWPKALNSNADWVPTGYTLGSPTPWRRVLKTIP